MTEKPSITARAIIELLGAPKEYIEKTLKEFMEEQKKAGLNVLSEKYHEAEKQQELYSAFVEVDVKFENVMKLLDFCFECMPSSIEIVEPEKLEVPLFEFNGFLNDLQTRLHDADMIVKTLRAQNEIIDKNAVQIFRNFIVTVLRKKPQPMEELSESVGVPVEHLRKFVDKLVEDGEVDMDGENLTALEKAKKEDDNTQDKT